MNPYYSDDLVALYHGDCREVTAWLEADVLVTDPPYGIAWSTHGGGRDLRNWSRREAKVGIIGDEDTSARDDVLQAWGDRPAVVFGSPLIAPPSAAIQALVWRKPADAGVIGARFPWRRDVEMVYLLGKWPRVNPNRSSVIESKGGLERYRNGHPHAKPTPVLEHIIKETPGGVIADPFAGSGSTLVAAKMLGRKVIGVEAEEKWCALAASRLAQDTLFGGVA